VEHKDAGHRIAAGICNWDRFRVGDKEVGQRPLAKMLPSIADVGLRQVEADTTKPRPRLFHLTEKGPSTAADVEKPQFALIASGEHFSQLRQGLTTNGIGGPIE
jgi:hypothetical protein